MDNIEKRKKVIIDSYVTYLETELQKKKNKIGTLDKEHLQFANALKRDYTTRKRLLDSKLTLDQYVNPQTVQFELTSKCNQSCIQCYNQSGMEKNKENADIPFSKWLEITKELADIPISQVIISGGEPTLLGDKLFQIMDIFHEVGVHFIFITNGMLINERNIKKFAKYNYAWLQFSVDGATEETHDYIRGAKGAFKKVIKAITLARAQGIPVGVASTIVKRNMCEVSDLIDLSYCLGAYKHTIGEFMYAGRAVENADDIGLTDDEIAKIRRTAIKKSRQYQGLMQVTKPYDPALTLRYRMNMVPAGMLIRPDGEVRIDCQAPARIGNVKENSIREIWDSVGHKGWSHPALLDYIEQVKNYQDLNTVCPRTHFDPDIDLTQPLNI